MAAIGSVMHKILRIVFGMLKHKQNFDPNIDKKNQANSLPKRKKVSVSKIRRFQNYDVLAPVSRRQNIKRKEEKKSQVLKLQAEHI